MAQHLSPVPARKLTSREIAKIIESFAGSLVPMAENGAQTMKEVYEYLGEPEYRERRNDLFKTIEIAFKNPGLSIMGVTSKGTYAGNG
jgi:hypothetical protein